MPRITTPNRPKSPEQIARRVKLWARVGYILMVLLIASIPASFVKAVFTGEWRWLLITAFSFAVVRGIAKS